jgi:hypothetical protein
MAGRLPSFASGSNLAIYLGPDAVAYGTNLMWSDDVAHAAVGGIGSYSYDSLEPLQYLARGSFTIVRYGTDAFSQMFKLTGEENNTRAAAGAAGNDGNSLLRPGFFNPSALITSRSFDINVYERALPTGDNTKKGTAFLESVTSAKGGNGVGSQVFRLNDCRLTDYTITFTPGQLVTETVAFICITAQDFLTQTDVKPKASGSN